MINHMEYLRTSDFNSGILKGNSEEKSMDGEQHNDKENSEVLKNVQVDHLAESSANSNRMTGVEDAPQSNTLKEESTEGVPQPKLNSESTEGEKPDCKSPGKLDDKQSHSSNSTSSGLSEVVLKIPKPLCANYRSGSDTDSLDSESDTSTSSEGSSETFSHSEDEDDAAYDKREKQGEKKAQKDLSLSDLPPIEDLKISVPESACVEVGKISGIVDTLVVVESYKLSAALDVDTVLFLDCGKRTLGKIFDVLGPITEPVYTVRFNNQDQIKSLNIEKEQKVYYAPKTQHTTFVFLSEVLKNKGSDASWKDNIEAPSEFQDFSDDEKERQHRDKHKKDCDGESGKEGTQSRKRSFSRTKQNSSIIHQPRFRHPGVSGQRRPSLQRNPPPSQFVPPPTYPTPIVPNPNQPPIFPYNVPPYPGTNYFATTPQVYYPPRFSGPAFPPFGGHLPFAQPPRGFHQPFFQQRSHSYRQPMGGMWTTPMFRPPPPPPPPDGQGVQQEHPEGKQK